LRREITGKGWRLLAKRRQKIRTVRTIGFAGGCETDDRLPFETGPAEALRLVDFILRRDLDRSLAGGGR
jgi:hypothetical protein